MKLLGSNEAPTVIPAEFLAGDRYHWYISGMTSRTAKVIWNGRSQAVRIPKEFRFESSEVQIRRVGKQLILEPLPDDGFGEDFWAIFGQFGSDFDTGDRTTEQDRELEFG